MRNISLSFILVAILLFVGCAPGASDRTTAVKRAIETREYNVDMELCNQKDAERISDTKNYKKAQKHKLY